jgi:hypothetical protein
MAKRKRTNNDVQNSTQKTKNQNSTQKTKDQNSTQKTKDQNSIQKTKDRATQTSLKTGVYSGAPNG